MWRNLRVAGKLGLGFGVVIVLAMFLGVVAWGKIKEIGSGWNSFQSTTLRKRDEQSGREFATSDVFFKMTANDISATPAAAMRPPRKLCQPERVAPQPGHDSNVRC